MIPRGEVGLIFAGIGKSIGILDSSLFSSVIILVILTTLITPPALKWAFDNYDRKNQQ
jgi:Kef-type K+ transport system membrane component KefB